MQQYSIGDLEKLSGVKAHTIRMWERRYGVVNPMRTPTNIRYYSEQDLFRLLNISILKQIGYRISKIAHLSDDDLRRYVIENIIESDNPEVLIETLVVAMLSLDEYKFLHTLDESIKQNGLEYTFEKVVIPFIDRLGSLCDDGTINKVQRSFIFNLIRQKLIVAIDEVNREEKKKYENRMIFFMPQAEWGEINLLFYSYVARREGFDVLYLGTSVQYESLQTVYEVKDDDILFLSVDTKCSEEEINEVVPFLNENYTNSLKLISGIKMRKEVEKIVSSLNNSQLVCSVDAFRNILASLRKGERPAQDC